MSVDHQKLWFRAFSHIDILHRFRKREEKRYTLKKNHLMLLSNIRQSRTSDKNWEQKPKLWCPASSDVSTFVPGSWSKRLQSITTHCKRTNLFLLSKYLSTVNNAETAVPDPSDRSTLFPRSKRLKISTHWKKTIRRPCCSIPVEHKTMNQNDIVVSWTFP